MQQSIYKSLFQDISINEFSSSFKYLIIKNLNKELKPFILEINGKFYSEKNFIIHCLWDKNNLTFLEKVHANIVLNINLYTSNFLNEFNETNPFYYFLDFCRSLNLTDSFLDSNKLFSRINENFFDFYQTLGHSSDLISLVFEFKTLFSFEIREKAFRYKTFPYIYYDEKNNFIPSFKIINHSQINIFQLFPFIDLYLSNNLCIQFINNNKLILKKLLNFFLNKFICENLQLFEIIDNIYYPNEINLDLYYTFGILIGKIIQMGEKIPIKLSLLFFYNSKWNDNNDFFKENNKKDEIIKLKEKYLKISNQILLFQKGLSTIFNFEDFNIFYGYEIINLYYQK